VGADVELIPGHCSSGRAWVGGANRRRTKATGEGLIRVRFSRPPSHFASLPLRETALSAGLRGNEARPDHDISAVPQVLTAHEATFSVYGLSRLGTYSVIQGGLTLICSSFDRDFATQTDIRKLARSSQFSSYRSDAQST
jgi:hypothetical protein